MCSSPKAGAEIGWTVTIPKVQFRENTVFYQILIQKENMTDVVFRRYNDFLNLDNQWKKSFPDSSELPHLPPKKITVRFDPEFIEQRRQLLEKYLKRLLRIHHEICHSPNSNVISFLPGLFRSQISSYIAQKRKKDNAPMMFNVTDKSQLLKSRQIELSLNPSIKLMRLLEIDSDRKRRENIPFSNLSNVSCDGSKVKLGFFDASKQLENRSLLFSCPGHAESFVEYVRSILSGKEQKITSELPRSKQISVFCTTWNMARNVPPESFSSWLDLAKNADIYAIGVQECTVSNAEMTDKFTLALPSDYYLIANKALWEIRLWIYGKRSLKPHIREIETQKVATGLLNILGNKGGVGISLRFHRFSLCFINCHLAPHRAHYRDRCRMYQELVQSIRFGSYGQMEPALAHDALFWMGDMNFRLEYSFKDLQSRLKSHLYYQLYSHDQLHYAQRNNDAFPLLLYLERKISFLPTYKLLLPFEDIASLQSNAMDRKGTAHSKKKLLRAITQAAEDGLSILGLAEHNKGNPGQLKIPLDDLNIHTNTTKNSLGYAYVNNNSLDITALQGGQSPKSGVAVWGGVTPNPGKSIRKRDAYLIPKLSKKTDSDKNKKKKRHNRVKSSPSIGDTAWQQILTDDGDICWYNSVTGQTAKSDPYLKEEENKNKNSIQSPYSDENRTPSATKSKISFKKSPTAKSKEREYNPTRISSWTDRILWTSLDCIGTTRISSIPYQNYLDNNQCNIESRMTTISKFGNDKEQVQVKNDDSSILKAGLTSFNGDLLRGIEQLSYSSFSTGPRTSDHNPVTAHFRLTAPVSPPHEAYAHSADIFLSDLSIRQLKLMGVSERVIKSGIGRPLTGNKNSSDERVEAIEAAKIASEVAENIYIVFENKGFLNSSSHGQRTSYAQFRLCNPPDKYYLPGLENLAKFNESDIKIQHHIKKAEEILNKRAKRLAERNRNENLITINQNQNESEEDDDESIEFLALANHLRKKKTESKFDWVEAKWSGDEIPVLQSVMGMRECIQLGKIFLLIKLGSSNDSVIGQCVLSLSQLSRSECSGWNFDVPILRNGLIVGILQGSIIVDCKGV